MLRAVRRVIGGELDFNSVAEEFARFRGPPERSPRADPDRKPGRLPRLPEQIDAADRTDIRDVLKTIVRGQELDLVRFGDPATAVPLRTSAELDEYTYLVAGCVGVFWTNLGFRHCPNFATRPPNEMTALGIGYGEGLQLINVLRDRASDTVAGRNYLPAEELAGSTVENVFSGWLSQAEEKNFRRHRLLLRLRNWRVRYATALPALIGARTIAACARPGRRPRRSRCRAGKCAGFCSPPSLRPSHHSRSAPSSSVSSRRPLVFNSRARIWVWNEPETHATAAQNRLTVSGSG
jgi:farnesyl-diphosphate farnesyltransferase